MRRQGTGHAPCMRLQGFSPAACAAQRVRVGWGPVSGTNSSPDAVGLSGAGGAGAGRFMAAARRASMPATWGLAIQL